MSVKRKTVNRLSPVLFLGVFALLFLWRVWGAVQVNRAFVVLNHLPSVFTDDQDPMILAMAEAQLRAAQQRLGVMVSTQRMLAIVQRAQGQIAPAGLTVPDLWWWGEQKEKMGEWSAAAYLYQWATEQQPDLGDSWVHLGRVYEEQNMLEEAITAYLNAAAAPTWHGFGPSDAYLALGNLYMLMESGLALDYYAQALNRDQFSNAAAKALTHYQIGELLLWHHADPMGAIPHYQSTLALTPQNHWARLRLGYALYWGNADLPAAEREIQKAISIWPDGKYLQWPYFYLGEIYQDAEMLTAAIVAYQQVLKFDPDNELAQERLIVLRSP